MLSREEKINILLTQEKILSKKYNKKVYILSASYDDENRNVDIRCMIDGVEKTENISYDNLYYEK